MNLAQIDQKTVAIVRLQDGTVNPECLLQVTIDPYQVSPSGDFMRFGAQGDEIIGWKRIDKIDIVEVIGWPNKNGSISRAPAPASAELLRSA